MIISKEHSFVFLRTRKVGSTAVEQMIASGLTGENLVLPRFGDYTQSHFGLPFWKNFSGFTRGLSRGFVHRHSGIKDVLSYGRKAILDFHFFSIERHPWDRAVSTFFWSMRRNDMKTRPLSEQIEAFRTYTIENAKPSFQKDKLRINLHRRPSQAWMYSRDQIILVDTLLTYETLDQELPKLGSMIEPSLSWQLPTKRKKADIRSSEARDYRIFHNQDTIDLVANECAFEIDRFGYQYDQTTPKIPVINSKTARADRQAFFDKL